MAGASMSGASPVDAGLSKATTGLGKIVTQLRQVESLLTSIGRKSGNIGPKGANVSSGGSMMSTSLAQFSTPPPGGDGNILAGSTPRFSGGVGGSLMAAGAYALGAAYSMVPTVDQAVTRQGSLHLASMSNPSTYNTGALDMTVKASFGGNISGVNSDVAAALALSRTGMNPMSPAGRSIMQTAGVAYQTLGMDNSTAVLATNQFYSGAQGSQLFQYGIRTRDNKGNPVSPTAVINQMYNTLYAGHKTPTDAQIGMDYQAGFLGQSLNQLGMGEDQKQIVLQGLRAKAESTRTGKSFSMNDVPGAAGNSDTNPFLSMGSKNAAVNDNISASMPGLVAGFNDAQGALKDMNTKMAEVTRNLGQAAQDILRADGFIKTMLEDPQGKGVGDGIGGIISSLIQGGSIMAAGRAVAGAAGAGGAAAGVFEGGVGAAGLGVAAPAAALVAGGVVAANSGAWKNADIGQKTMAFTPGGAVPLGIQNAISTFQGFMNGNGIGDRLSGAWNGFFGNNNAGTPSHASGTWDLPKDEIAHIHKGEMILPASIADAIRRNVGKQGSSSGGGGPVQVTLVMKNSSDSEVMRVGKQLKSIIENPSTASSVKEK